MNALHTTTISNKASWIKAFEDIRHYGSKSGERSIFTTVEEAIAWNKAHGFTCIIQPPVAGWPMPGLTFVEVYKSGPESSWVEVYWTPGTHGLSA